MKLTPGELDSVRTLGLFIREKCDSCGKVLNQALRYTIKDQPEVYCSAECRDRVFFGEAYKQKAKKASTCIYCGGKMDGKRAGSRFCAARCKMAFRRLPGKPEKACISVTASPQNQSPTNLPTAG